FSAYGLREGYAHRLLLEDQPAQHPLVAACASIGARQSRFGAPGNLLYPWISPLFPGGSEATARLHLAACWLSDLAWSEQPDYRAEQPLSRVLPLPIGGIDHVERVYLATVLHARYGGAADAPVMAPTRGLIDSTAVEEAHSVGQALRLA